MRALSEIFFLSIVFYLLYRFVFGFLLPVVRTTRQVRQQFRNMQGGGPFGPEADSRGSDSGWQQNAGSSSRGPVSGGAAGRGTGGAAGRGTKPPAGDYIDFEEIKD